MSADDREADAAMEQVMKTTPPMDTSVAATLLREAKEIMDEHGVAFFLRQGTCLGAIRDNAFISWDDDIDIGSIEGGCVARVPDFLRVEFVGDGGLLRVRRDAGPCYSPSTVYQR